MRRRLAIVLGALVVVTGLITVGLDPKMELANAYGVRALPASFIVDRRGHLAALALGPREWDNAASQALVEGLSH